MLILRTLVCIAALAQQGCAPLGTPYTLRFNEAEGSKLAYSYVIKANSDPTNVKDRTRWTKLQLEPSTFDVTGEMETEVVKVEGGKRTVKTTNKTLTATGTGFGKVDAEELLAMGVTKAEYEVDEFRKFTSPKTVMDPMTNTFNGIFPKDPVRVGQTYTYDPFPGMKSAKVKVAAVETLAGFECIKLEIDVPGGEGEKTGMEAWFDLADGKLVKCTIVSDVESEGMKFYNKFTQTLKTGKSE